MSHQYGALLRRAYDERYEAEIAFWRALVAQFMASHAGMMGGGACCCYVCERARAEGVEPAEVPPEAWDTLLGEGR